MSQQQYTGAKDTNQYALPPGQQQSGSDKQTSEFYNDDFLQQKYPSIVNNPVGQAHTDIFTGSQTFPFTSTAPSLKRMSAAQRQVQAELSAQQYRNQHIVKDEENKIQMQNQSLGDNKDTQNIMQNSGQSPEVQSSEDQDSENSNKPNQTLSPEEISNQQLLKQQELSYNRPSRNERLTRLEQQVQNMSTVLTQQQLESQRQSTHINQNLSNMFVVLNNLKSDISIYRTIPQGQNQIQNPSPEPSTQNYHKNQQDDNIPDKQYTVHHSPGGSRSHYEQYSTKNQNAGYIAPPQYSTRPVESKILYGAPSGGDIGIQNQPPPPPYPPNETSSAPYQHSPIQVFMKTRRDYHLRNYNGDDNPQAWLNQFQKFCTRTEVPQEEYLDEVRDFLSGKALGWYERNYSKFCDSFEIFKELLQEQYRKDPAIYETQLSLTKQNQEEDLRSFLKRLEQIAKPACLDESRIRLAFLRGIKDKELQVHARQSYLFNNGDRPLEHILIALQDYESNLRYLRKQKDSGGAAKPYHKHSSPREDTNKTSNPPTPGPNANRSSNNTGKGFSNKQTYKSNVVQEQDAEQNQQTVSQDEIAQSCEGEDPEQYQTYYQPENSSDSVYVINERPVYLPEVQQSQTFSQQNVPQLANNFLPTTQTQQTAKEVPSTVDMYIQKDLEYFQQCLEQAQDQSDQSFHSQDDKILTVDNPLFDSELKHTSFQQNGYTQPSVCVNGQLPSQGTQALLNNTVIQDHHIVRNQQSQQGQNIPQPSLQNIPMNIPENAHVPGAQVYSLDENSADKSAKQQDEHVPQIVPYNTLEFRIPEIEKQYPGMFAYQLIPNHMLRYIYIKLNNVPVSALVDTGCTSVILTIAFIQDNGFEDQLVQRYRQLSTAENSGISIRDILPNARITFFEKELQQLILVSDMLIVAPNPSFQIIVGQSFLNFFMYQVAADGLHLRLTPDSNTIIIRYIADLVYQVYEQDVDNMNVLTKDSSLLSKEQLELYPGFPTDKRDILLIDPPWTYFSNKKGIKTPQYPQLSFQQLLKLPIRVISKEDGILLLWVTSPMFKQALQLILNYGYTYKTILFVWVKLDENDQVQQGYGHYTDPCCEYLVLSTKGQFLKFLQPDIKVSQLFRAQNLKKSRKPVKIYELLPKVFKLQLYNNLEIFSCMPEGSELFSHYGNGVPGRYQQSLNIPQEAIHILDEQYLIKDEQGNIKSPSNDSSIFLNQEELVKSYEKENLLSEDEVLSSIKVYDPFYKTFLRDQVSIFSRGDADLGQTDIITHKIQLLPNSVPKRQRPYKTGQLENKAIEAIISDIETIQVIRSESSPYQHPVVLVRKPNGKYRMCINYKYLNSQTVDDKYPIPLISYLFTLLAKGKIFTKLDGKSGFWQVLMDPESIPLTGFVTHNGQYVYLRMPFGLKNAPATFQRLMNQVLQEYINDFVIVYIDDVIVFSPDRESHLIHLDKVFSKIRAAKIKLGADKCEIGFPSLDVLGHTVSHQEIRPKRDRVEAIHKIQPPTNVTELRSFIGLCSYYRQYIPKFAQIANQLFPLINKGVPFLWEDRHTEAFNKLKHSLADNSVLQLLLNDRPLVLYTDFSILGIGAVLAQKVSDRKEKVIEFASRTLQKYERSLDSYCGEVLAVYWAMSKFRQYILSVPFPLEIVTDNKALEWVLRLGTSSPVRKIQRWTMEIDSYSYTIRHRKGTTHVNADALSRLVGQIPSELQPTIPSNGNNSILYMEDVGDLACTKCKLTHEDDHMAICDRCGDANHIGCINVSSLSLGPFYCPSCLSILDKTSKKDIIYNKSLYTYLLHCKDNIGTNGLDPTGISTCRIPAADLSTFQQFALFHDRLFKLDSESRYLLVPTEVERQIILREQHHLCGHGGIERTKAKISEQYWWRHLHKDATTFVGNCEICNITNPKFSAQPELHPIQKGTSPFQIVSADLITNLQDATRLTRQDEEPLTDEQIIDIRARVNNAKPRGRGRPKKVGKQTKNNKKKVAQIPEENVEFDDELEQEIAKDGIFKHCIVVIDVFSKYVELGALKSKSSDELYKWFDQHVICRHGSPFVLRTDQGTEFMGGLKILCEDHSIEMKKISPHYPQANGQAEATVKNVTNILRKFLLSKHYQYLHWWDMLPYVQRSINTSVTKATTYTPFEILHGRKMRQVDSVNYTLQTFSEGFVELSPQEIESYVTELQQCLSDLQDRVKIQLNKQDERMKQQYEKLVHKEHEFQKGQRVYVQKQRTNKLQPKVDGPYIFQGYNKAKTHAEILNPDSGRSRSLNTNILSPATAIQFVYL